MPEWIEVATEARRLGPVTLASLFAHDPDREARLTREGAGLRLDLSRERLDARALDALLALAERRGVAARRDAMFGGRAVNVTESRAALHVALRGSVDDALTIDGVSVAEDAAEGRAAFLSFADEARSRYEAVLSIGIGGSDLGPAMATRALSPWHDGPPVRFVSNLDPADFADATRGLDPARTLVIVQSKSFRTQETLANARLARDWLGPGAGGRMAAVSSDVEAAGAFGIAPERVFGLRDWVGGRFSVWSAIGLPLAIAVGPDRFGEMLAGARAMDLHFRDAAPADNLPLLWGLVGAWRGACGLRAVATIPYAARLARFPAWLQQLEMESNGKRVTETGEAVPRATAPLVWGEPGTDAQHSFFQFLHQSPAVTPVDFILVAEPSAAPRAHHAALLANGIAQAQALAFGREDREAPHKDCPGDRPSTILALPRLDPDGLGRLLALCEHRTFVQGVLWGVDSFDQWGVELGKTLAETYRPALEGDAAPPGAPGLIRWLKERPSA